MPSVALRPLTARKRVRLLSHFIYEEAGRVKLASLTQSHLLTDGKARMPAWAPIKQVVAPMP